MNFALNWENLQAGLMGIKKVFSFLDHLLFIPTAAGNIFFSSQVPP